MTMRKNIFSTIITLFTFAFLLPVAVQAGIGVSPGEIANDRLQPGSHYETEIVISQSDPSEDMQINVEVDAGIASSWFSFSPSSQFIITKGVQRYPLHVIVDVPEDAPYQSFDGAIRVKASPVIQGENAGGVAVVKGARLEVALVTTELSITDFTVRSLKLNSPKQNEDLVLEITLENTGNTNTTPTSATIDIRDLNDAAVKTITSTTFNGEVLPGETGTMTVAFTPGELEVSEYFADVKVYLDDNLLREDTLVFAVTKGDEVSTESAQDVFAQLLANKPLLTFVLMSITAILLFLILLVVKKKREDREKILEGIREVNHTKLYVVFCVIFLVINIIIFLVVNLDMLTSPATTENVQGMQFSENIDTPAVRGTSAEPNSPDYDRYGRYPIYTAPNLASDVLYIAKMGEKFGVKGTEGDWYKVEYVGSDGATTTGWLHKSSIMKVGE